MSEEDIADRKRQTEELRERLAGLVDDTPRGSDGRYYGEEPDKRRKEINQPPAVLTSATGDRIDHPVRYELKFKKPKNGKQPPDPKVGIPASWLRAKRRKRVNSA